MSKTDIQVTIEQIHEKESNIVSPRGNAGVEGHRHGKWMVGVGRGAGVHRGPGFGTVTRVLEMGVAMLVQQCVFHALNCTLKNG